MGVGRLLTGIAGGEVRVLDLYRSTGSIVLFRCCLLLNAVVSGVVLVYQVRVLMKDKMGIFGTGKPMSGRALNWAITGIEIPNPLSTTNSNNSQRPVVKASSS